MKTSTDSVIIKYADDLALGRGFLVNENRQQLQVSLDEISSWSHTHDLYLNANKCYSCIFTTNRRANLPSEQISIGDRNLDVVENIKYLGTTLSANISWSKHVELLFQKCVKLSFCI